MLQLLALDLSQYGQYILLGVLVIALVAMFVWSSRSNKKKQEEADKIINSVKPGNKVKTIGGICGIVVAIDPDENTFVLETGSVEHGKCYIKFDKQAIYQTDAVADSAKPAEKAEENAPAQPEENAPEQETND